MTENQNSRTLFDLARAVKRGVKLLNKKVPNWRQTLQIHKDSFDFADGDHCILGTLEHYNGVMKKMRASKDWENSTFDRALNRFFPTIADHDNGIVSRMYGFDADVDDNRDTELQMLSDLWRAEFLD